MIYDPMVHLAQTMNLSCIDTNTVAEWAETRFHKAHVTKDFHWVRTKQFPRLWYVLRKPGTYLALTLTLFPNGPK
jgi:hypothetical protein